MSVVVSPYFSEQKLYDGKQTDLLDALLESCQKSAMNPRLAGYGRELQPYFDSEYAAAARLPAHTTSATKANRKNRKPKGHSSGSSAQSSDDDGRRNSQEGVPRAAQVGKKQFTPRQAATPGPPKTTAQIGEALTTFGVPWAGPGFGMAPAVNELPMPSKYLLN